MPPLLYVPIYPQSLPLELRPPSSSCSQFTQTKLTCPAQSLTEQATTAASAAAATTTATASAVADNVFSMFGGGAKKEKKDEDEDRGETSGSAKAQKEAAADNEVRPNPTDGRFI
jgi:hypothetical protein